MAGFVIRLGDTNVAGGAVITGNPTVRAAGLPVATLGAAIAPHPNFKGLHSHATIMATTPVTVRVGGLPIASSGAIDSCGHQHVTGCPTVRVGL